MKGGKILAKGNVDAFAATAMKGGELTIEGNAGNYLGAAYRGDWRGMSGGKILVKGNAGSDIGMYMTRRRDRCQRQCRCPRHDPCRRRQDHHQGQCRRASSAARWSKATSIVFGSIEVMMPGFKPNGEVELEVDGTKAKFAHFIGDMGERHKKKKGVVVYGNLYKKI